MGTNHFEIYYFSQLDIDYGALGELANMHAYDQRLIEDNDKVISAIKPAEHALKMEHEELYKDEDSFSDSYLGQDEAFGQKLAEDNDKFLSVMKDASNILKVEHENHFNADYSCDDTDFDDSTCCYEDSCSDLDDDESSNGSNYDYNSGSVSILIS